MRSSTCASLIAAAVLVASGCGPASDPGPPAGSSPTASAERQLNVTLLLDLSDRVDPEASPATPSHRDRDIEAAAAVADAFVAEMERKGAFLAEGRIRTVFTPTPDDPDVNALAASLAKDLRGMSPADKKGVHDDLPAEYRDGLARIYDATIADGDYVGSDLWRFFRDGDAANIAVDPDPDVRNVLVVLTDGYLYHRDTAIRDGNRTSYVTGSLLAGEGLREATAWRGRYDAEDYGFIDPGADFPRLEVLVLEVSPSDGHPGDFEVLEAYWSDLLGDMEVARFDVLKTDLPANVRPLILRFIEGSETA